jgi:hypothetical protein
VLSEQLSVECSFHGNIKRNVAFDMHMTSEIGHHSVIGREIFIVNEDMLT